MWLYLRAIYCWCFCYWVIYICGTTSSSWFGRSSSRRFQRKICDYSRYWRSFTRTKSAKLQIEVCLDTSQPVRKRPDASTTLFSALTSSSPPYRFNLLRRETLLKKGAPNGSVSLLHRLFRLFLGTLNSVCCFTGTLKYKWAVNYQIVSNRMPLKVVTYCANPFDKYRKFLILKLCSYTEKLACDTGVRRIALRILSSFMEVNGFCTPNVIVVCIGHVCSCSDDIGDSELIVSQYVWWANYN